jgi:peroxidase
MTFTRSLSGFDSENSACDLGGFRRQVNTLSHFLDGSQIYGVSETRNRIIRELRFGKLRTSPGIDSEHDYMVNSRDSSCRDTDSVRIKCFAAGENRTNENLGLASIQTLFLREHNRIATDLSGLNPRWNDDRLFDETRKIVIGILQHIFYQEFVTAVLGWETASRFDLVPQLRDTFYSGYDPNVDPSLANDFVTVAFRFGHALTRNIFTRADENMQKMAPGVVLQDIVFRPVEAYK